MSTKTKPHEHVVDPLDLSCLSNDDSVDDGSSSTNRDNCHPFSNAEKLNILKHCLEVDLMGCDGKWTLFVAAAQSDRLDLCLKPYPKKYASEQGCDIEALMSIINDTPSLPEIEQRILDQTTDRIDCDVVDLLHWVLVEVRDHPVLKTVPVDRFLNDILTVLPQKGSYTNPTHVFEVCPAKAWGSEESLLTAVGDRALDIAFYGGKLDEFFSIIHGGFQEELTRYQRFDGLSLCTELAVVGKRSPIGAAWGLSACGAIMSCVGLCEFVKDEDFVTYRRDASITHVNISKHALVRIRYLLVYGSHVSTRICSVDRPSWFRRNGVLLSMCFYLLVVSALLIANQDQYWRKWFRKNAKYLLSIFKKLFGLDY